MKDDTLLAMLTGADEYISGEDISRCLGVSRTAVWKYVEDLRKAGYVIEAVPRRGYRLVARTEKLVPTEVRAGLTTERLGQVVHYFPQVGSTNDVARKLAQQGAAEGTIVVAEEQTKDAVGGAENGYHRPGLVFLPHWYLDLSCYRPRRQFLP